MISEVSLGNPIDTLSIYIVIRLKLLSAVAGIKFLELLFLTENLFAVGRIIFGQDISMFEDLLVNAYETCSSPYKLDLDLYADLSLDMLFNLSLGQYGC